MAFHARTDLANKNDEGAMFEHRFFTRPDFTYQSGFCAGVSGSFFSLTHQTNAALP